jgi:pimeloyl-ACP methyl ester carboxylesterase
MHVAVAAPQRVRGLIAISPRHGRADPLPVSASEETAALMSTARLHVIEDCGHFPWIEYPGALGELIRRVRVAGR